MKIFKYMLFTVILILSFSLSSFGSEIEVIEDSDIISNIKQLKKSMKEYNEGIEFNMDFTEPNISEELSEEQFLSDLKESFLSRQVIVDIFDDADRITVEDFWLLCKIGVISEQKFYDKYKDHLDIFENKKYKTLCESYLKGLKQQFDTVEKYFNDIDEISIDEREDFRKKLKKEYKYGCIVRESVIFELNYLYNFGIDTSYFLLQEDFDKMIEEAKAENYTKEKVTSVQQKLTDLGYDCGGVDGIIGKNTVLGIYDYQRINDLLMSGKIDDKFLKCLDGEDQKEDITEHHQAVLEFIEDFENNKQKYFDAQAAYDASEAAQESQEQGENTVEDSQEQENITKNLETENNPISDESFLGDPNYVVDTNDSVISNGLIEG